MAVWGSVDRTDYDSPHQIEICEKCNTSMLGCICKRLIGRCKQGKDEMINGR
jgi:hypothetical protein